MNKIYTLVGIPASGKSTFAQTHKDCEIISTDSIRKEILGSEENQEKGYLIFKIAYKRVQEALDKGLDIIFDATNVTTKTRKDILKFNAYHIAVVFDTPLDICKQRNLTRDRHVPEEVIDRMFTKFTCPTLDEGFDEIIHYKSVN